MVDISVEESFLLQAHALAECYVNLGRLEASKDPIIEDNKDKIFGQTARLLSEQGRSVFQGQGVLVSVFYMLLVLPLEWKKKGVGDFGQLDLSEFEKIANAKASVIVDSYGENNIAFRHFRNSLAHGRLGWENGNLVVEDESGNGKKYRAKYSMDDLGELAQSLNMAIAQYIESVIKPRQSGG